MSPPRIVTPAQARGMLDGTTPGPWHAEDDGDVFDVSNERAILVATVESPETEYRAQDEADARLIAAAPDLAATVAGEPERVAAAFRAGAEAMREACAEAADSIRWDALPDDCIHATIGRGECERCSEGYAIAAAIRALPPPEVKP